MEQVTTQEILAKLYQQQQLTSREDTYWETRLATIQAHAEVFEEFMRWWHDFEYKSQLEINGISYPSLTEEAGISPFGAFLLLAKSVDDPAGAAEIIKGKYDRVSMPQGAIPPHKLAPHNAYPGSETQNVETDGLTIENAHWLNRVELTLVKRILRRLVQETPANGKPPSRCFVRLVFPENFDAAAFNPYDRSDAEYGAEKELIVIQDQFWYNDPELGSSFLIPTRMETYRVTRPLTEGD